MNPGSTVSLLLLKTRILTSLCISAFFKYISRVVPFQAWMLPLVINLIKALRNLLAPISFKNEVKHKRSNS